LARLASGIATTFDLPVPEGYRSGYPGGVNSLEFLDEQTILTMGWGGLRRWDLSTGTHELLAANDGRRWMDLSRETGMVVAWAIRADLVPPLELIELATGSSRTLEGFGDDVAWAGLGRRGPHPPPMADAGPRKTAASHPPARRAAGEAALANQPPRRARPRRADRLDDRARPLPWLAGGPDVVAPSKPSNPS
jgi:hypothetical protein